jgi:hypothetical protein
MTPQFVDVQCQLTIPRPLAAGFDAPAAVKAYLIQHHVWPERVQTERWRLDTIGYVVDLTVAVPEPQTPGATP